MFFHGQKKARKKIRAENYHQREDGGNMKKHSIALIEYKYIIIFLLNSQELLLQTASNTH